MLRAGAFGQHVRVTHVVRVRAQLERISACPLFAQAGRISALLKYLVESKLDGTARDVSQYRLAIDVLGRAISASIRPQAPSK